MGEGMAEMLMTNVVSCLYCPVRFGSGGERGLARLRGVCPACYQYLRVRIRGKEAREDDLVRRGLMLPKRKPHWIFENAYCNPKADSLY